MSKRKGGKTKKHETNDDEISKAEGEAPLPGVRFRKWGSCVAELKVPFTKQRACLGTFATIEEANEAVRAKREEFRVRKEVRACMVHTRPVFGSDKPIEEEGRSGGLDLNQIPIDLNLIPIDHNGYQLDVYRTLDDTLSIE